MVVLNAVSNLVAGLLVLGVTWWQRHTVSVWVLLVGGLSGWFAFACGATLLAAILAGSFPENQYE